MSFTKLSVCCPATTPMRNISKWYKLLFLTLLCVWLMPKSCNKSSMLHSYYFSSSITCGIVGPCLAPSPLSVWHRLEDFWAHGCVWKNVFPRLCHKNTEYQSTDTLHSKSQTRLWGLPDCGHLRRERSFGQLVWRTFLSWVLPRTGSPVGKGQQNKGYKLVRVTEGVQIQPSLFYLVGVSHSATLLPVMIYGDF